MLQFDVCCKAIGQNFDSGCDRYAILHLDSLMKVLCVSIRTTNTNIWQISSLSSCSQIIIATNLPIRMKFQNFLRQTTNGQTGDGQNQLLNPLRMWGNKG